MKLDFLKDIKLEAIKKGAPTKPSVVKLPVDAHIRVFANGKVYPSKAFAESMSLEFVAKQVLVEGSKAEVIGNGMDIFSSVNWGMVEGQFPKGMILLFAYIVPKSYAKVDLWANTKYDDDGIPKASVFTQGNSTFSRVQLLPMLTEAYGIDWTITEHVDLVLSVDNVMVSPNKMYDIPKVISGGAKKGELGFQRRQNIDIYPLVVHNVVTSGIPAGPVKTPDLEPKVVEPIGEMEVVAPEVVTPEVVAPVIPVAPATPAETTQDPISFGAPQPETPVIPIVPVVPVVPAVPSAPVAGTPTPVAPVPTTPVPVQPVVPATGKGDGDSSTSMAGQNWAARLATVPPPVKK